nr:autotransporter-associated beta strand repeat-containing protein [Verrucomicrobiales bacterium]
RDMKVGLGAGTSGRVDQIAGTHNTGGWTFVGNGGGNGTYNIADTATSGGTFTGFGMGSGSHATGDFRSAEGAGSVATININTSGSVNTNGGAWMYVGTYGSGATGTMNLDNGTVNASGFFVVGNEASTGYLNMSGGAINTTEYIIGNRDGAGNLSGGNGTVVQTGGIATGNNWVLLGRHSGTAATYTLSGNAVLRTTNAGGGVFAVSHSNNTGGATTATLTVSGNAVASAANEMWIGNGVNSTGIVHQNGGTVTANSWLAIGRDTGNGTYNLNAGSLSHTGPNHTIVGSINGVGTLTQKGSGIFNESNDLRLGEGAAGQGTYDAQGGTGNITANLVVGWVGGGTGLFKLNGGTVNASNVLIGGDGTGTAGNGTVELNSGTLFTNTIQHANSGGGTASLQFNGGTIKARSNQAEFFPVLTAATTEILAGGAVIDTNGFDIATGLALDGIGGLSKTGTGKLTLNGISTYSGTTNVLQGTLALGAGATLNPSSVVNLATGATFDASAAGGWTVPLSQSLTGNGSIVSATTINGTISPGNSIGTLTFDSTLTLNGETVMEIDRTGPPISDLIVLNGGTLDLGGDLTVTLLGGSLQLGDTFNLFDAPAFVGSFGATSLPDVSGLGSGDWSWDSSKLGVDGTLKLIPEPATSLVAGLALLGFLVRRRRR